MKSPTHEEVAHVAFQIWQDSGRPEGHHGEHWQKAELILSESPIKTAVPTDHTTSVFNQSYRDQAPTEAAETRRIGARSPIKSTKTAPTFTPPESGKPLWDQPHSR